MTFTQGNRICRGCFCKSHFSRRAFLCPSVLPVAADDLPVASGRLYPRRTGRLSGLFIRQEAPYRLKITLTGKNQVAFRAALGSPRRFQASSRPATPRMRRPAAGPSLFQIPTFSGLRTPDAPSFFGHPMCFSGVHHHLHASPALLSFTFGHCAALFQAPSGTSRCTRFQASAIPGAPSAFEPVLCKRDSRQLCPLLFALYRVQGLLLVSLCSGRTFALPFTLGRPIVLLKATLCDAIVCRRGCKTRFYTRAIYHYAWQSKGNAPPFLQQSPCLIYVCVQRGGGCKSQPATACFT